MSSWVQCDSVDTDAMMIGRSLRTPEVFGEVFDRHWDSVYRYCRSRAGDAGEDLAAETFCLAFDRRGTYELDRPDAGPWLLGLATNLIRNHLRHSDRGQRAVERMKSRRVRRPGRCRHRARRGGPAGADPGAGPGRDPRLRP